MSFPQPFRDCPYRSPSKPMRCASTESAASPNETFAPMCTAAGWFVHVLVALSLPGIVATAAYTPGAGRRVRISPRLAVGKPSVRPRFAPSTTTPVRRYGAVSTAIAPATSPAEMRLRTRELDTTASLMSTGATTSNARPWLSQSVASAPTSPSRPLPKRKSVPSTSPTAPRRCRSTWSKNDAAERLMTAGSTGCTHTRSMPRFKRSSARRAAVESGAGAKPGRTRVAGCGSKVSATDWAAKRDAICRSRPMIAAWPTCTPSKLPTVTTVLGRSRCVPRDASASKESPEHTISPAGPRT